MTALINHLNASTETDRTASGFAILHGTLAPEGCVVRLQGFVEQVFDGSARVFASTQEALAAINAGRIRSSDILILRHDMPVIEARDDLGAVQAALDAQGLDRVILITDGRIGNDAKGAIIGHVGPSASAGGPIGYVQDDDIIHVDIAGRRIDILADIDIRRGIKTARSTAKLFGPLEKYARLVSSASAE